MCATAAEVYRELGDYSVIIPSWLAHPGVMVFVDEAPDGELRGFILIGFYTSGAEDDDDEGPYVADLLAIGVAPAHQRRGIGRRLLDYALDVARAARGRREVPEIRLTVAEDNAPARHLFEAAGFELLDADYGTYDGGQRALRLHKKL